MSASSSKSKDYAVRGAKAIAVTAWVFVSFVISWLIMYGLQLLLLQLGVPIDEVNPSVRTMTIAALTYSLTIVVALAVPWFLRERKTTLGDLGLARLMTWVEIPLSIAGFIVYSVISAVLLYLAMTYVPGFDGAQVQNTGFTTLGTRMEYLAAFIALVVLAPVAEEVIFRGYLFGNLRKYVPFWLAALIVSVLFGFVHGQWNVALDTFALSLVLCSLREISGSLWPSILLHMLKNSVAFYLVFINPSLLTTMGG